MPDRQGLEALFHKFRFTDFTWIAPATIVVAEWVRMKCLYGCPSYGRNAACPPNTPSVEACRAFFREYAEGVLFHFTLTVDRPEERRALTRVVSRDLLALEREVFLAGHPKAFLLFMDSCSFCSECVPTRDQCRHPRSARPAPEGLAVDVFSTVRQHGLPIEVLTDYRQAMNRYAILLVE
jgi:predicted metal-binding protein